MTGFGAGGHTFCLLAAAMLVINSRDFVSHWAQLRPMEVNTTSALKVHQLTRHWSGN